MRRLALLLVLIASCSAPAMAADLAGSCGVDTDRSGTVDNWCEDGDADHDGFADSVDCDYHNHYVYDGISTGDGCAAGQFRTCAAGVFGACAVNSTYSAKTNSGVDRWVTNTADVATCGHAGTYADPNNWRCHFNTGMAGYVSPAGDDAILFKCKSYTDDFGTDPNRHQILFSSKSGTSGHTIKIRTEPGCATSLVGSGTVEPNPVLPIDIQSSSYIDISGNAYGQQPGLSITGNYANVGISLDSSGNDIIRNVYVTGVDGLTGTNNIAGIKLNGSSGNTGNLVSHVHCEGNYGHVGGTPAGAPNGNNAQIQVFKGDTLIIRYSTFLGTVVGGTGNPVFYKHGASAATWTLKGNIISGGYESQVDTAQGGLTMRDNLIVPGANTSATAFALQFGGGSGFTFFDAASTVLNNTIMGPIQLYAPGSDESSATFALLTIGPDNIIQDDRGTAYPGDGGDGFIRIWHYGSDANFCRIIQGGAGTLTGSTCDAQTTPKILFTGNCESNSAGTALFYDVFLDNGTPGTNDAKGTSYANFGAWILAALVSSETNENSAIDAAGSATSTNCKSKGAVIKAVAATPSPAPTLKPSIIDSIERHFRR